MTQPAEHRSVLRFGVFEADLRAGELRRNGRALKLQEKPFQLLTALLEQPGEVVTKEELQERLWPDVAVDADAGLGEAVYRLRQALDDSAHAPRYVQTVPKRGYRFIAAVDAGPVSPPESEPPPPPPWKLAALLGGLALAVLLLGGAYYLSVDDPAPTPQVRRFSIRPALPLYLTSSSSRMVSVSPNGRYIAYVTETEPRKDRASWLWIHDLRLGRSRRIEGIGVAKSPFWSADSRFVIFGGAEDPEDRFKNLLKVPAAGGPVAKVSDLQGGYRQGSAGEDDTLFIHAGSPGQAWTVPLSGGSPQPVFSDQEKAEILPKTPKAELDVGWFPQALPSVGATRGLLFGTLAPWRMYAMDLASRRLQDLGSGREVFYSPTGHLLYRKGADLWATPFSPATLQTQGEPFRVRDNVRSPTASNDGLLVYFDGTYRLYRLAWRSRGGARLEEVGPGSDGMISQDGNRVVMMAGDRPYEAIEWQDIRSGRRVRLAEGGFEAMPVWSPDGDEAAISSTRDGEPQVYVLRVDGSGKVQKVLKNAGRDFPDDWSHDGKFLAIQRNEPNRFRKDLVYAQRDPETDEWTEKPLRQTEFDEYFARFSPHGRYYAYVSDETGSNEIIVREFPNGERRWVISRGEGAGRPRWSRESGEIFYVAGGMLYAVKTSTKPEFTHGKPTPLFPVKPKDGAFNDVSADGRKFLFAEPIEQPEPLIRVVENWYEEFRNRKED